MTTRRAFSAIIAAPMKNISRLLFLALPLLAALRAQSGPAPAESSIRSAAAAKATAPQPPPAPSSAPSAMPSPTAMTFGPVAERSLLGVVFGRTPGNPTPTGTFLDLKSGNLVDQVPPGNIAHAIYDNDHSGIHFHGLATVEVSTDLWDAAPNVVIGKLAGVGVESESYHYAKPGVTYFFKTAEGVAGIFQFFAPPDRLSSIRYKLIQLTGPPPPPAPKP